MIEVSNRGRTALYRLFGAGKLLYIGISDAPETRWRRHARTKQWWPLVERCEVEWFDDRADAESAEALAILVENPMFNVVRSDRLAPGVKATRSPAIQAAADEVVDAFAAISAAQDRYRSILREYLGEGGDGASGRQAALAKRLNRTREMLRQDAMTHDQREERRRVVAERKRSKRTNLSRH